MPERESKAIVNVERASKKGRTIQVLPTGSFQGFVSPKLDEDVCTDVVIQPIGNVPLNTGAGFQIRWWRGEAFFDGPTIPLNTRNIKEYQITARQVQVNFAMPALNQVTGQPNLEIDVNVAVGPGEGGQKSAASAMSQWLQSPVPPAAMSDQGIMTPFGFLGGRVYEGAINLYSLPPGAAQVWLLLFDIPGIGGIPANQTPVPGGRSPALSGIGSVELFNGQSPLEFGTGIVYGLSLTPDKYTAPAAGGQVTVDLYQGG